MTSETQVLARKLEAYLSKRLGAPSHIQEMKSLSGGACQDNYLVDLRVDGGTQAGEHALVLRTDKGGALLNSLTRSQEFVVAAAAHAAGVKTPEPRWLEEDATVVGNPFYFMQRISGRAQGRYVVKDRELGDYRKQMPADIARNLAAIHSVRPGQNAELDHVLGPPPKPNSPEAALRAVGHIRRGLDELGEAHPALELGLNWLTQNANATPEPVLVHGDFRTGNFMVSPEGLQGIVDWEFAHWGDPHEDISWLCLRDWRFGKNNKPVGGFADREPFYRAYAEASGRAVDATRVHYWEIFGNAAWGLGAAQQARRHLSGQDRGIEYASIGRRACEMEWELMRLIENAG